MPRNPNKAISIPDPFGSFACIYIYFLNPVSTSSLRIFSSTYKWLCRVLGCCCGGPVVRFQHHVVSVSGGLGQDNELQTVP